MAGCRDKSSGLYPPSPAEVPSPFLGYIARRSAKSTRLREGLRVALRFHESAARRSPPISLRIAACVRYSGLMVRPDQLLSRFARKIEAKDITITIYVREGRVIQSNVQLFGANACTGFKATIILTPLAWRNGGHRTSSQISSSTGGPPTSLLRTGLHAQIGPTERQSEGTTATSRIPAK